MNQWIIDRIRVAAAADRALVPVHALFGVRALDARLGHAEFGQRMGPWLLDSRGRLSPGAFLSAVDAALSCAINSTLSEDQTVMSLTIRAQFVRLQPGGATHFVVSGDAIHVGESSGFAAGEIVDDTGRLLARLTTHCGYLPASGALSALVPAGFPIDVSFPTVGDLDGSGDDELSALARHRMGAGLVGTEPGEVRVAATATPEVCNSRGDVQGGALGLLAEQAVSLCLARSSPALAQADNLELDVNFLRPLRPDSPDIAIVARAEHAGRRFGLAHAQGFDSSGRALVSASGSSFAG